MARETNEAAKGGKLSPEANRALNHIALITGVPANLACRVLLGLVCSRLGIEEPPDTRIEFDLIDRELEKVLLA